MWYLAMSAIAWVSAADPERHTTMLSVIGVILLVARDVMKDLQVNSFEIAVWLYKSSIKPKNLPSTSSRVSSDDDSSIVFHGDESSLKIEELTLYVGISELTPVLISSWG